jgi:futalosine hydrolase
MMSTIIIAATDREIAWLAGRLHARSDRRLLDFPVSHAEGDQAGIRLITCGPGMANAAAAAAAAIERYRPARLYNTGICGVYAQDCAWLGKAVLGARAVFADTGAGGDTDFQTLQAIKLPLAHTAGTNIYNSIELSRDAAPGNIPLADFLTVAAVSGSPAMAAQLSGRFPPPAGTLLCEDMESAAVALACLRAGIPCTVVRGISNLCGERDHSRWKIDDAVLAAQELLFEMLKHYEQTS